MDLVLYHSCFGLCSLHDINTDVKHVMSILTTSDCKLKMDTWSQPDQTALEKAIRSHPVQPGEPAIQRWTRIASAVPGKGVKACLSRIKSLQVRMHTVLYTAICNQLCVCLPANSCQPFVFSSHTRAPTHPTSTHFPLPLLTLTRTHSLSYLFCSSAKKLLLQQQPRPCRNQLQQLRRW